MTEEEWLIGTDPEKLLDHLRRRKYRRPSDRKFRLFACACCRRFPSLLLNDNSRANIAVAERYADGLATEQERDKAYLSNGFGAALNANHPDAVRAAAWAAYDTAYYARNWGGQANWLTERAAQCHLLRDIVGNPFRDRPILDPAWLAQNDGIAVHLARTIYNDREFSLLPYLADALEEAGCTDTTVLEHGRRAGEHARGCWVVDWVLGLV